MAHVGTATQSSLRATFPATRTPPAISSPSVRSASAPLKSPLASNGSFSRPPRSPPPPSSPAQALSTPSPRKAPPPPSQVSCVSRHSQTPIQGRTTAKSGSEMVPSLSRVRSWTCSRPRCSPPFRLARAPKLCLRLCGRNSVHCL